MEIENQITIPVYGNLLDENGDVIDDEKDDKWNDEMSEKISELLEKHLGKECYISLEEDCNGYPMIYVHKN